ncbi:MAG TPA: phenylacetate--CoA ligase family protein, partial [Gammaproteobacteria bacterium]
MPGAAATTRLTALFQLEQSQWWSEKEIREQQFKQICSLLRHCVEHVPYYKERLGSLINPAAIDEQQWLRIPVLTRDEVQRSSNDLCCKQLPASHGKASLQRTSGSTGKPIQTLTTEISTFFWTVFALRDHLWHRRNFNKKLAVIRYTEDERAKPPQGMLSD